jgi:cytochrome c
MARSHAFPSVMTGTVCTACVMLLVSQSASQERDVASGQLVFNNACRTCHTTREGDNRLGPNLYKIVGRKAGSLQNYGYSSAMKGADFVWDEAKLDRFIANLEQTVPGNNMKPFSGLASADDRAKVIAFLLSSTTADEAKSHNAAISRSAHGRSDT